MPFDCEALGDGLLAQPINSLSSLAFLVAAVVVWRSNRLASVSLIAVGVGSIAFHGQPSTASSWSHDLGLAALVAVVAAELWRRRRSLPWPALGMLAVGVGVWFVSRTGGAWCDPWSAVQGHAVWHVLAATAVVWIVAPDAVRVRA